MKLTDKQKLEIGRQMYQKEKHYTEIMEEYGISDSSAHACLTSYKKANGIPLQNQGNPSASRALNRDDFDMEAYMAMSKEELIRELIISKANELRAKKGYEVRGVGANKEFVPLNRSNSKS